MLREAKLKTTARNLANLNENGIYCQTPHLEVCSLITPGQVNSKARVSEFFRLTRFCVDVKLSRFAIFVLADFLLRGHGVTVTTRSDINRELVAHNARSTGSPCG